MDMSLWAPLKFGIFYVFKMFCAILMQWFTQNLFIFYLNFIRYDRLVTVETIICLCSYVEEIYVLYLKTLFCY